MSSARVGAAAAVLGRRVVIAGGYRDRATEPLDTVEAFDPATGRWMPLPPMPTRRYGLVLASSRGCLFAIGGDDGHNVCTANEVYDLRFQTWRQAAPLPRPLAGGKGEAHDGFIYYVGGCDQHEELSSAVYVYCPGFDRWDYARHRAPSANATQTSARDAIGDEEGSLVSLRTGRTSFAMAILGRPQGGPLWVARSTRDPSARLVVTGGVSGMADELFLSDTELLPLMGPQRHVAPAGRDNAGVPSCPDILQAMVSVPRTPQPRSGCRSVVLWPMPRRRFLPWLSSCEKEHNSTAQDPVAEGGATPFLVVLGGETPNQNGVMMEPCQEPIALDVVGGCWHSSTHSVAREAPGAFARRTDHDDFLEAVGRLRTGRVAFAMAVAQGLPRVATHSG